MKEHSPNKFEKEGGTKVHSYYSLINRIINYNNNLTNSTTHIPLENFGNDKNYRGLLNKQSVNDNQETKFSVAQFREKTENFETHKKGFFVISDELKEEEDDMSIKLKRDIIVSKLMHDKSIMIDKQLQNNFNDNVLASVYLSLSHDSRKLLIDNYSESMNEYYNGFHNMIGFQSGTVISNLTINNDTIINMCNNFIRMEDCK